MTMLPGLYEVLLTDLSAARLQEINQALVPRVEPLRDADAADRIALHLALLVERAIESLPEDRRAATGVEIARSLVEHLASHAPRAAIDEARPASPGRVLRAVTRRLPDSTPETIELPLIPLLDTALLTNSPGEPRVGHQVRTEIMSSDRIDLVMAFIRRSGIKPLLEPLRRHTESGRSLRVLTTTYTGSTEPRALDDLRDAGADIRVSYDLGSTRLHAKAWLFHRDSGFSTAYVGSSNLTHTAQVDGLEWNIRLSGVRNRAVIEKITAVFESYWEQPDFVPYEATRFLDAVGQQAASRLTITLSPVEIRLEPFQERLLEQIELARQQGRHRNLLVAATGTGKTVMAAVDYARLRRRLPRARLLFVAHREEILGQSRATFAHALRDATFGEMWVGGQRPRQFDHVFASIQSLSAAGLASLDPRHFDVVVVDEFHHAAADSYRRLLEHLQPRELLGLTATPERADGLPLLHWFDGRIAAELRLWDAIDQHRLVPFHYFGIADELNLSEVPWRRGSGYDVEGVTRLITGTDVWARAVLKQFQRHADEPHTVRALGFCVSVEHARYMARVFNEHGVNAVAVWSDTPDVERRAALSALAAGELRVLFSVDLFNEGVDVPAVDALLMLRPTDSPVLFLQQLGRGLRKTPGKAACTVLDFVGQHRHEFRYDRRFRALLGGSRAELVQHVERGFPFLPAGCHMELDRVASERVIQSIRDAVPSTWNAKAVELRAFSRGRDAVALVDFLEWSEMELEDIYPSSSRRSWSDLRTAAGLAPAPASKDEIALRRACGRLLHVDDEERLGAWGRWLVSQTPPALATMLEHERRLLRMLVAPMLDQVADAPVALDEGAAFLWSHGEVRRELLDLVATLRQRVSHVAQRLTSLADVPLQVRARYTRAEILAACGVGSGTKTRAWREGVLFQEAMPADLLAFTFDKSGGQFSPTTRYRDYAISPELIHWESQSMTRADSPTGRRYQEHAARGSHILLFARETADQRAFYFLGPATYVKHEGERPMAVTWKLQHKLPGDLFQSFAAAVA